MLDSVLEKNRSYLQNTDSEVYDALIGEEKRQKQFNQSLSEINSDNNFKNEDLIKLINCYIDIANADEFIHDNEIVLIQHAIEVWSLDISIEKPKTGKKLSIK